MDVCLDVQKLRWWPFQKRRGPETVAQRPRHPQAASPRCLSVRRPREGQGRLHLTLQHLASLCLPAESKHPVEGVSRSACPPHPHPTGLGVRLPPKWSLGGPALWSSWKSMQNHRNVPGGVLQVQDGGQGWPVEKVWWSGLGWEQLDTAEEGWRRGRPATPGLWAQLLASAQDRERVSLARPGQLSRPASLRDGVKKKTQAVG